MFIFAFPFLNREELKTKFEGRLSRECSGSTYEVMGTIMKAMVNRKITIPGNFVGHSGTPAVGCSVKAAAGYLYPLERGFIYVHKPPIHIRFEEIASVNFARGGGSTRSFDFEVETKNGVVHTFSSIEKEEYNRLYDFINSKKLRIKNTGRSVTILITRFVKINLITRLFSGKGSACRRLWRFRQRRSPRCLFGSCQSRRQRTRCNW